jgi:hypothetical protein
MENNLLKFLPEFKQVEPQLLHGLTAGWMLAQRPVKFASNAYGVKTVTKNDIKFIENGIIVGLDAEGFLVNADDRVLGTPMYLVFSEEKLTVFEPRKYFATEVNGAETFVRAIGLLGGDEFVTNNFALNSQTLAAPKYAKVVDGVLTLQATAEGAPFYVVAATLADNTPAAKFLFIGEPMVAPVEEEEAE